nr:MAG TPA: hypothetical protein [Caudoviricetes sp.]
MADSEREYTHVDFLKDDNGDFYYCDELGNRLKGVNKINGFYYLFGTVDGVLKVEWQTPNDKRYYYSPKDGNPVFGFIKYHGKFYYVDYDKGKIVSETITIDGLDYTFDENGVLTSDVDVDVKDKLVTLESIGVLHLYAENNYLKVADCVGKYWIDSDGNKQGEIHGDLEGNQATKECSFAGGFNCLATDICTFAIGNYATASGNTSASIGQNTEATGDYSFATNYFTKASGLASFSEGYQTVASGDYSHAEGYNTQASGTCSHAEGSGCIASDHSHAEGYSTQASAPCSHSEGYQTIASGDHSHAEGWKTEASGAEAHAEGSDCIASGLWSHAEGRNTKASGEEAHAEGECTIAAGSCQHASGKYNLEDVDNKYAFIIGNGEFDTEKKELIRSNAFAIDWNGKIYIGNDTTGVDLTQKVATIFVNAAIGNDTENNGNNLAPVQTLKRALQLTQYARKAVIYLAAGEYTIPDKTLSLLGQDVRIYGDTAATTIIKGNIVCENSFLLMRRVTVDSTDSTNANATADTITLQYRAAIRMVDCTINTAGKNAINITEMSNANFVNTTFQGATQYAVYVTGLSDAKIYTCTDATTKGVRSGGGSVVYINNATGSNFSYANGSNGIVFVDGQQVLPQQTATAAILSMGSNV